jgi:hypothetical protein
MIKSLFFQLHSRAKIFFAVSFLLLMLTLNSFSQIKTTPKPLVKQPSAPTNFVMCEVMPVAEVASKAPFTIPLLSAEPVSEKTIRKGCVYKFKKDADEAGVSIGLTDLGSVKNALTSYKNAYQASKDLWEENPASVIALRDTGFFSGKDECGLKFHLGKYILDINFQGQFDTVSAEQKKEAGILLAAMVMDRLKYLWKTKEK